MNATRAINPHVKTPASGQRDARLRVLIVDDHALLRDGLRTLIDHEPDLCVCGEAVDEPSAVRMVRKLRPDLVVVDLSLQNGNGLDLIKWIRVHEPAARVVVSTMHDEKVYGERALRAGARGYVNKQDPARTILDAIRRVRDGKLFFSEELTSRLVHRAAMDPEMANASEADILSDRELEVFELIGQGLTASQIADRLHLSRSTVDTYRERIKTKLGVESASELNYRAFQWNRRND